MRKLYDVDKYVYIISPDNLLSNDDFSPKDQSYTPYTHACCEHIVQRR